MPVTARLTFSIVNSSARIALHPEVPNLICVGIVTSSLKHHQKQNTTRISRILPAGSCAHIPRWRCRGMHSSNSLHLAGLDSSVPIRYIRVVFVGLCSCADCRNQ